MDLAAHLVAALGQCVAPEATAIGQLLTGIWVLSFGGLVAALVVPFAAVWIVTRRP